MKDWKSKSIQENLAEVNIIMKDLTDNDIDLEPFRNRKGTFRIDEFKKALPILSEWLNKTENLDIAEWLVRGLTHKLASPYIVPTFLKLFEEAPPHESSSLKWAIGNALEFTAGKEYKDSIIKLIKDKSHGRARQMLVMWLGKKRIRESIPLLIQLLDEDGVQLHAISSLKTMNALEARENIEKLLNHPSKTIQKEAKKALAKFDKIEAAMKEKN